MEVVKPGGTLLTVTERGFGKRTEIEEYRVQSRGGVGVINITTSERNGLVVGVSYVQDGDELLVITQQGMILRMLTDDVRSIGRATQGVTHHRPRGERQGRVDRAAGREGRRGRGQRARRGSAGRTASRTAGGVMRLARALGVWLMLPRGDGDALELRWCRRADAARAVLRRVAPARSHRAAATSPPSSSSRRPTASSPASRSRRSSATQGPDGQPMAKDVSIVAPVKSAVDGRDGVESVRGHDEPRRAGQRSVPIGDVADHRGQRRPGISFDSAVVITHSPSRFARLTLASRESTVG